VCQCLIASYLWVASGLKGYFIYWLLPYCTVFQSLTWFIELSKHYPMIKKATKDIQASRNRFSHPIEHFFTAAHNENFHLVHHLFPAIPYWNLKKAHQILLNDSTYADINAKFGGIFVSSNSSSSMWQEVLRQLYDN